MEVSSLINICDKHTFGRVLRWRHHLAETVSEWRGLLTQKSLEFHFVVPIVFVSVHRVAPLVSSQIGFRVGYRAPQGTTLINSMVHLYHRSIVFLSCLTAVAYSALVCPPVSVSELGRGGVGFLFCQNLWPLCLNSAGQYTWSGRLDRCCGNVRNLSESTVVRIHMRMVWKIFSISLLYELHPSYTGYIIMNSMY